MKKINRKQIQRIEQYFLDLSDHCVDAIIPQNH